MRRLRAHAREHAPVLVAVAVSVVWLGLALRAPTTTYHLLPGAVAWAWPATARSVRGRQDLGDAVRASIGGFGGAVGAVLGIRTLTRRRRGVVLQAFAGPEASS